MKWEKKGIKLMKDEDVKYMVSHLISRVIIWKVFTISVTKIKWSD
jgi:hypothetical protein